MQDLQCALCGPDRETEILYPESIQFKTIDKAIFSARRIPDRVHYRLLRCKNCGLIFSSPILPDSTIKKLYRGSAMTYDQEVQSLSMTYGNYLTRALSYVRKNPRLLEIGGGNGFFLEKAKEMGFDNITGIEPSESAVSSARPDIRKYMIVDFFPSKKLRDNYFDVICIFQTLDHIVDPNTFLRNCLKALRKGGIVLCILHNTDGLSVKLLGERSPIFDIEHIYLFNTSTLQKILEKNGFHTLDVFDVKNTFSLRYWMRMFPIPFGLKGIILKLFDACGIGSFPVSLSAGNIGIIAQK